MIGAIKNYFAERREEKEVAALLDTVLTGITEYKTYLKYPNVEQGMKVVYIGSLMTDLWPRLNDQQKISIEKLTWEIVQEHGFRYLDNLVRRLP